MQFRVGSWRIRQKNGAKLVVGLTLLVLNLTANASLKAQDYRPFSEEAEQSFQQEVEQFRNQTPTRYEIREKQNRLENTLYNDEVQQPITRLDDPQSDRNRLYNQNLFEPVEQQRRGDDRFEARGGESVNLEIDIEQNQRRRNDRNQQRAEAQNADRNDEIQLSDSNRDRDAIAELEGRENRLNGGLEDQNNTDRQNNRQNDNQGADEFEDDFLRAERELNQGEANELADNTQTERQTTTARNQLNRQNRQTAQRGQNRNRGPVRQDGYDPLAADNNDITGSIRNNELEDIYAQQGKRIGTFLLFPELTITGHYSDNPTASVNNGPGDSAIEALTNIRLSSDWSRHQLELQGQYRKNYYDELTSENIEEWLFRSSGRLDISNNHYLELEGQIEQTQDSRGDIDNLNSDAELANLRTMMVTAIYNLEWNRTTLRFRGNLTDFDYEDVRNGLGQVINNDDQDYLESNISARLSYTLHTGLYLFTEGSYVKRDYDQARDDIGFERGNDGETISVGMIFDPTSKIRLEGSLGFQWLNADDARFIDMEEVVYTAAITYRPSRQTSLRLSTSRELEGTDIDGTVGVLETDYRAELNHYFRPHILMTSVISYEIEEFQGINITEETLTTSLALQYIFNQQARVIASYELNDVSATGADYQENIFRLGLNLRP